MKTLSKAVFLTAMSAAVALAQPGGGMMGQGKGDMKMKHRPDMEQMADELDLTAEQRQAMEDAQSAFRMNMIDLRATAEKARLTVRTQMRQTTVNRDEVMKAVDAEGAADLAIRKAVINHQLAIRTILGPEKIEKMHEMRKSRGDEDRDRGGYRGGSDRDDDDHDSDDRDDHGDEDHGDEDHGGGEHQNEDK